jgi:UPF0271 protein
MTTIDLNADVGEMDAALDAHILGVVSSVSVACGGHAGDDASMRRVTSMAAELNVRIGAHPSFVDREGFGRTRQDVPAHVLVAQIREQILRLADNSPILPAYVKPHGALYHAAGSERETAAALLEAVASAGQEMGSSLAVMGQHGFVYTRLAQELGMVALTEGFADRAYDDDGRLLPRSEHGALITEQEAVLQQVAGLARGAVSTVTGKTIRVSAQSVCLHSDTPGAGALAASIRRHLTEIGIDVRAWP